MYKALRGRGGWNTHTKKRLGSWQYIIKDLCCKEEQQSSLLHLTKDGLAASFYPDKGNKFMKR